MNIIAVANNGKTSSVNDYPVRVDSIPPYFSYISPIPSWTNIKIVSYKVTAEDGFSGVKSIYYSINDGDNILSGTNININFPKDGSNKITLGVYDYADNNYSTNFNIYIQPSDGETNPPVLNLLSPTNGEEVEGIYNLIGTVYDTQSDINNVYVKVLYPDQENQWQIASMTDNVTHYSWKLMVVIPFDGIFTNLIYAEDSEENTSAIITNYVQRIPSIPEIEVLTPLNDTYLNNQMKTNLFVVPISGRAFIKHPNQILSVTKKVGLLSEQVVTNIQGTNNIIWHTTMDNLSAGTNDIIFKVICNGNRIAETSLGIIVDDTLPIITNVGWKIVNNGSDIDVNLFGEVWDKWVGIRDVFCSVDSGPFNQVIGYESWSNTYNLTPEIHTIDIFARDDTRNYSLTNRFNIYTEAIYVSAQNGNDANVGITPFDPVKTLQTGIARADQSNFNIIFVDYTTQSYSDGFDTVSLINHNTYIQGGWNTGFSMIVSKTLLDGGDTVNDLIKITGLTNIRLKDLIFCRSADDGLDASGVSNCNFDIVAYSNNSSGLHLSGYGNTVTGSFCSNSGRGMYLENAYFCTITNRIMLILPQEEESTCNPAPVTI